MHRCTRISLGAIAPILLATAADAEQITFVCGGPPVPTEERVDDLDASIDSTIEEIGRAGPELDMRGVWAGHDEWELFRDGFCAEHGRNAAADDAELACLYDPGVAYLMDRMADLEALEQREASRSEAIGLAARP